MQCQSKFLLATPAERRAMAWHELRTADGTARSFRRRFVDDQRNEALLGRETYLRVVHMVEQWEAESARAWAWFHRMEARDWRLPEDLLRDLR
jgi:hypothetical protein